MVFIDGSWMYHNRQQILEAFQTEDFDIDYQKIPFIIERHLREQTEKEFDIVRTHYFGSIPINKPGFDSGKQDAFYKYLADKCFFETEIYNIDFRNDPSCRPKEKCVDIALASSMLFNAAMPGSYDVAALVVGDVDYLPVIRRVRSLGKRSLLVGLKKVEGHYPTSNKLISEPCLFDFPPLFLDDHLEEIRLHREQILRRCMNCRKTENTTWAGKEFYCVQCRAQNTRRIRICDTCSKEEETSWNKDYFYCAECRGEYRKSKYSPASQTSSPI